MNNTFCIFEKQDNTHRSCDYLNTTRNIKPMGTWQSRAKFRMKSKKITQEKLAEMLGVTQGAVGHWLSGRRDPDTSVLMSIAKLLEMDVGEMLSGQPEESPSLAVPAPPQALSHGGQEQQDLPPEVAALIQLIESSARGGDLTEDMAKALASIVTSSKKTT